MSEGQNRCLACGKVTFIVETITVDVSAHYHKSCFKCTECKRTLSTANYVSRNGSIYCDNHKPSDVPTNPVRARKCVSHSDYGDAIKSISVIPKKSLSQSCANSPVRQEAGSLLESRTKSASSSLISMKIDELNNHVKAAGSRSSSQDFKKLSRGSSTAVSGSIGEKTGIGLNVRNANSERNLTGKSPSAPATPVFEMGRSSLDLLNIKQTASPFMGRSEPNSAYERSNGPPSASIIIEQSLKIISKVENEIAKEIDSFPDINSQNTPEAQSNQIYPKDSSRPPDASPPTTIPTQNSLDRSAARNLAKQKSHSGSFSQRMKITQSVESVLEDIEEASVKPTTEEYSEGAKSALKKDAESPTKDKQNSETFTSPDYAQLPWIENTINETSPKRQMESENSKKEEDSQNTHGKATNRNEPESSSIIIDSTSSIIPDFLKSSSHQSETPHLQNINFEEEFEPTKRVTKSVDRTYSQIKRRISKDANGNMFTEAVAMDNSEESQLSYSPSKKSTASTGSHRVQEIDAQQPQLNIIDTEFDKWIHSDEPDRASPERKGRFQSMQKVLSEKVKSPMKNQNRTSFIDGSSGSNSGSPKKRPLSIVLTTSPFRLRGSSSKSVDSLTAGPKSNDSLNNLEVPKSDQVKKGESTTEDDSVMCEETKEAINVANCATPISNKSMEFPITSGDTPADGSQPCLSRPKRQGFNARPVSSLTVSTSNQIRFESPRSARVQSTLLEESKLLKSTNSDGKINSEVLEKAQRENRHRKVRSFHQMSFMEATGTYDVSPATLKGLKENTQSTGSSLSSFGSKLSLSVDSLSSPSRSNTVSGNQQSRKKRVENDITGGTCQVLGGTPQTMEILKDFQVKAAEEGRCLLAGIARMEGNPSTGLDSTTLLFGYFFNTSRRICEIAAPIISVLLLKKRMQELSKLERSFRVDTESDSNERFVHYKEGIDRTLEAIRDLTETYEYEERLLFIKPTEGYRIEVLGEGYDSQSEPTPFYQNCNLEHIDHEADYYRKHFYNTEHKTYVGISEKLGPVIFSLKSESNKDVHPYAVNNNGENTEEHQWRCILRMKEASDIRMIIPGSSINTSGLKRNNLKAILQYVHPNLQHTKITKIANPEKPIDQKLLSLDEMKLIKKYKFGVLYCKQGQTQEEEMFGNIDGSESFKEFLSVLGDTVQLKGFNGYKAGLDTEKGQTGQETVNTKWKDYEVTYHVSTMLPYFPEDAQQIQRKRHIGNDIVCIVFIDGDDTQFDPTCVRSHFLHIFIAIKEDTSLPDVKRYKVMTTSNVDVGTFGPPLTNTGIFIDKKNLRDFLLSKMINGENAAYKAPKFVKPHIRTRNFMIDEIVNEHCGKQSGDKAEKTEKSDKKESTMDFIRKPSLKTPLPSDLLNALKTSNLGGSSNNGGDGGASGNGSHGPSSPSVDNKRLSMLSESLRRRLSIRGDGSNNSLIDSFHNSFNGGSGNVGNNNELSPSKTNIAMSDDMLGKVPDEGEEGELDNDEEGEVTGRPASSGKKQSISGASGGFGLMKRFRKKGGNNGQGESTAKQLSKSNYELSNSLSEGKKDDRQLSPVQLGEKKSKSGGFGSKASLFNRFGTRSPGSGGSQYTVALSKNLSPGGSNSPMTANEISVVVKPTSDPTLNS